MSFYKWTKWHAKEEGGSPPPLPSLSPPRRDSVLVREGLAGPRALGIQSCHPLFGTSGSLLPSSGHALHPSGRAGGCRGPARARPKPTLPSNQALLCAFAHSLSLSLSLSPSLCLSTPSPPPRRKGMRFKFGDCC